MADQLKTVKDEALVARSQAGDKLAMEELLRRHSGLVRSCARRYFLVGGETEDLLQEGMIALYHSIGAYDGEKEGKSSFKNFAYLCISRQIYDAIKKQYSKKNALLYGVQSLDSTMVEQGLDPEELLIVNDEQKELRQKMSRALSDFEFKIVTMYMDGMTSAEICDATGKAPKSVDNAIQRSKRKLSELMKKRKE